MKNVAVFFGGKSVEHDVSIISGVQVCGMLRGYNVIPIYKRDNTFYTGKALKDISFYTSPDFKSLKKITLVEGGFLYGHALRRFTRIDVAVLAFHGGEGEDGRMQGLLDVLGIPYTSSSTEGSAVAMNKLLSTIVADSIFIDVPLYISVRRDDCINMPSAVARIRKAVGNRVIVKPAGLGSSIGITVADTEEELSSALELAFSYDDLVLCMEYLDVDYELNVALLSNKGNVIFSDIEKPKKDGDILSFSDKYIGDKKGMEACSRELPALIDPDMALRVKRWAKKLYRELGLSGVVRIDFIVSKGYLYFNEINPIPGSLATYLFRDIKGSELLDYMIEEAIRKKTLSDEKLRYYPSDILRGVRLDRGLKK